VLTIRRVIDASRILYGKRGSTRPLGFLDGTAVKMPPPHFLLTIKTSTETTETKC